MRAMIAGLALFLLATTPALAGPFGIDFGQQARTLKGAYAVGDYFHLLPAPTPDPAFAIYSVHATEAEGVCAILGRSLANERDYSALTVAAYEAVKADLTAKYGPARPSELRGGEIRADDWTVTGAADRVVEARLDMIREDYGSTFLELKYSGDNYGRCLAAIEASPPGPGEPPTGF